MSTVVSHSPSYRRAATRSAASATISRRELAGWAWLGVAALAIAGLFAVLLAFSRLPGVEKITHWPIGFFGNALGDPRHLLVIWLMAIFGLLVAGRRPNLPTVRCGAACWAPGQGLVAASFPCLFVPAFLGVQRAGADQLHSADPPSRLRRRPCPAGAGRACAGAADVHELPRARRRRIRRRMSRSASAARSMSWRSSASSPPACSFSARACSTARANICSGAAVTPCNSSTSARWWRSGRSSRGRASARAP